MRKVIITGGGGFLGKALCKRLRSENYEVISIARGDYPELLHLGVKTIQCDISTAAPDLIPIFKDAFACFHVAAKVAMWGDYDSFFKTNVVGTRNILEACQKSGVKYLVFTSSPSVIANGRNLQNVDESMPYPERFHAFYPQTKAQAEQEILKANSNNLYTISLRPHLIFGPGDTSLEKLVVDRAKQGRLIRVGSGENLVDFSYIDDCVEAHLCALRALQENPNARGRAFFISQGIPTKLWTWIDVVLKRYGLPEVKRSVPASIAKYAGMFMEWAARILNFEPPFTRFLAEEMATDHYFDISAAKQELGYIPRKTDLFTW